MVGKRFIYSRENPMCWAVLDVSMVPAKPRCYVPIVDAAETNSESAAELCDILNREYEVRAAVNAAAPKGGA